MRWRKITVDRREPAIIGSVEFAPDVYDGNDEPATVFDEDNFVDEDGALSSYVIASLSLIG